MEVIYENRYAITAVVLFGIGFCTVLLKQNLLKKVLGFDVMIDAACWLVAALAPASEEALVDTSGLMLVGIVMASAVSAFSMALIWRVYRRYGTIQLKELLYLVRKEDE